MALAEEQIEQLRTKHGGKIEVASRLNRGTTFKVLLPIREPQLQLPHYNASREVDCHV